MNWKAVARRLRRELGYYRIVAGDPRTPWLSRVLIGLAIAYLLSPIDIIPDFIPILGYLDDLVVVPGLIRLALAFVPHAVKTDARARTENRDRSGGARSG